MRQQLNIKAGDGSIRKSNDCRSKSSDETSSASLEKMKPCWSVSHGYSTGVEKLTWSSWLRVYVLVMRDAKLANSISQNVARVKVEL